MSRPLSLSLYIAFESGLNYHNINNLSNAYCKIDTFKKAYTSLITI